MTDHGSAAIRDTLASRMDSDPSVVVLGESVGRTGGFGGATRGLLDRFGAERVMDLPIADRATLGFAMGLALAGKRPVIELPSTGRLPAVVEVLTEAAELAAGEFPCPLVVRVAYGAEAKGLDRVLGDLGGPTVACAADPGMAAGLLHSALEARGPVVLLEPRGIYARRGAGGAVGPVPFQARVRRAGDHLTLAAWGMGVASALAAADVLAAEGHEAEVVDLVTLAPLDRDALGRSLRKTGRLVVVHPEDDALADRVRQAGLDEAFLHLEAPLARAHDDATMVAQAARDAVRY